jgi:hypothetical protein
MISRATGLPIASRLSPRELRENEIRTDAAQGPVPACLQKGYESPTMAIYTKEARNEEEEPKARVESRNASRPRKRP